jgi:UDP-GlcNAc:undecaprenyl-phosphate GlcNAc-1-phosphate transferase
VNGFPPFLFLGSVLRYASVLFFVPLVSAWIVTPFFRSIAHKTGLLDIPNGALKKHEHATAYLGGVAVYVAATLSYFFLSMLIYPEVFRIPVSGSYFVGLTILFGVGLIDDIFAISPFQKIVGQCVACLFFIQAGLFFKEPLMAFFLPPGFCSSETIFFIGIALSLWWMLSIINAINLLDIMDGLAVTVSFVALCGIALYSGAFEKGIALLPFLGVLAGFFLYNKPRASIYLGDTGSLILGGVLATTPFIFGWGVSCSGGRIMAPLIILLIPIVELCWLMWIRTYLRIPFYYGSPHHFALYLKSWGWSVKQILAITGLLGALCGMAASLVAF